MYDKIIETTDKPLQSDALASIEAEVINAFNGLVEASEALDSSRYFEYIDRDKFTGLNADGKVWHGFKELEQLISTGFQMVERSVSLEFFNVKVTVVNPTTAVLVNEYKQTSLLKNKSTVQQSGGGMQVWHKSEGKWELVSIGASDSSQRAGAVF